MDNKKIIKKAKDYLNKGMDLLRVCSSIHDKVPKRTDSITEKIVKFGAISQIVFSRIKEETEETETAHGFLRKQGLELFRSKFLSQLLIDFYKSSRVGCVKTLHESQYCIYSFFLPTGTIYLVSSDAVDVKSDKDIISDYMYITPGTQLSDIFLNLWSDTSNRLYISKVKNTDGTSGISIEPLRKLDEDIFLFERNESILDLDLGNCYLIHGPPGTGKTSFAIKFAEEMNKKLVKLDSSVISDLNSGDYKILLNGLKPDVILIDDFDRTALANGYQSTLYTFEMFHIEFSNILILLTSNYPNRIEKALMRTGRIDNMIEFPVPNEEERKVLIEKYFQRSGAETESGFLEIVAATEELAHADVVGFAKKANKLGVERTVKIVKHLKDYQKRSKSFDLGGYAYQQDQEDD